MSCWMNAVKFKYGFLLWLQIKTFYMTSQQSASTASWDGRSSRGVRMGRTPVIKQSLVCPISTGRNAPITWKSTRSPAQIVPSSGDPGASVTRETEGLLRGGGVSMWPRRRTEEGMLAGNSAVKPFVFFL